MSSNAGVTVLLCFSPTASSGLQKPDEWVDIQALEGSQACRGFWEATLTLPVNSDSLRHVCAMGLGAAGGH